MATSRNIYVGASYQEKFQFVFILCFAIFFKMMIYYKHQQKAYTEN